MFLLLLFFTIFAQVLAQGSSSKASENLRLQIFVVGTVGCFVTSLIIVVVRLMRKYTKRDEKYANFD